MNREKILAKVQKLLDMAKHAASNEYEASTALRQAEAIMRKHDIEFAEIEAQTLSESDMEQAFSSEKRNSKWVWNLAWAASYLTSTMPTKRRNGEPRYRYIVFCGTKQDTQVAMMMFDYMVNVTERLAKEFWGDRTERNSFKAGAAMAILNNARNIKDERERDLREASSSTGTDLVLVKEDMIIKEFSLSYTNAKKQYVSDENAYRAGYQKGSTVSLNNQIGAATAA